MITQSRKQSVDTVKAKHNLDQTRMIDLYALDASIGDTDVDPEAIERMLNMIPTRKELAASRRNKSTVS